jgi:hypothetical protein
LLQAKSKVKNRQGCRCSRAGKDAGVNNSLGFAKQNPKLKNGMEAIFEQRKG